MGVAEGPSIIEALRCRIESSAMHRRRSIERTRRSRAEDDLSCADAKSRQAVYCPSTVCAAVSGGVAGRRQVRQAPELGGVRCGGRRAGRCPPGPPGQTVFPRIRGDRRGAGENGRAQGGTPVTNAQLGCRILVEKKK